MIWKLYKIIALLFFRCAVIASSGQDAFYRLGEQVNKINRLIRIIEGIRQYHGLHPRYAKDTYGTLEGYLKRHVSESDWVLLTQLQLIPSMPASVHHQQILKIA